MHEAPLRILITCRELAVRAGTQLYTRELAEELRRLGHSPLVFSPRLGEVAEEIRARGVAVVDSLDRIGAAPDVIHGQHHLEAMAALLRFPAAPALYVCHGWLPWQEAPPRFPSLLRYVAVDALRRDRLVLEHGIPESQVTTVRNWVDLDRFPLRQPLPPRPRRALLLSNQASQTVLTPAVEAACRATGIELTVAGFAAGRPVRPEEVLAGYDLVFARGRAAMEAMAMGCAVILCDLEGSGPLVTAENFHPLWELNFGLGALQAPVEPARLRAEIERYDPDGAARVRGLVRAEAGKTEAVARLVAIYRELAAAPPLDGEAHVRACLDAASRSMLWLETRVEIPERRLSEARAQLADAARRVAEAEARRTEANARAEDAGAKLTEVQRRLEATAAILQTLERSPFSRFRRRLLGWRPVVAVYRALKAGRPWRRRPRILALLACRNEMRYLPDYFESVRSLVDGVVALDDGSTDGSAEYLARQPEVIRLLRIPPGADHVWDDALNHKRLVEAAWEHNPDWLLGLDADERLEKGFRERAEAEIERARREGIRAYRVHVREIWDDPLHFRADGLWGGKASARFFEARRDHEFHLQRLHCHWAPLNSRRPDGHFEQADLYLYHLKMLHPKDREARRARYESLDPGRDFQSIGYAYLTDTEGLRLERIAAGREYGPVRG